MSYNPAKTTVFLTVAALIAAGLVALNLGTGAGSRASAQPECKPGDGGEATPTPTDEPSETPTPEPSGSALRAALPVAVQTTATPSATPTETASPTGSPSASPTGGGLPTGILTILPGDDESGTPTASPGGDQECESEISIRFDEGRTDAFKGAVRSGDGACEQERRVILKKKRSGRDPKVGATVTNRKGRWKIPATRRINNGRYYARTPAAEASEGDATFACKGARSETIRVRRSPR